MDDVLTVFSICNDAQQQQQSRSIYSFFLKCIACCSLVSVSIPNQSRLSFHLYPSISARTNFFIIMAKQIWRELSDMFLIDKVLQFATLPEAALGVDSYLSSVTTISDVVVSGDLQVVKVYVSIFGDERGREVAMDGLKSKVKYVRSQLGRRMKLRLTPEIYFIEDESIEKGSRPHSS